MRQETKLLLKAYERCGSVAMTAKQFDLDEASLRKKLINALNKSEQCSEHLSIEKTWTLANEYLNRPFTTIRNLMKTTWAECGVAICHVGNQLIACHPKETEGELVGVYNKHSHKSDMLADLHWYIKNEMEKPSDC